MLFQHSILVDIENNCIKYNTLSITILLIEVLPLNFYNKSGNFFIIFLIRRLEEVKENALLK